jgi:hypothetical protein
MRDSCVDNAARIKCGFGGIADRRLNGVSINPYYLYRRLRYRRGKSGGVRFPFVIDPIILRVTNDAHKDVS